MEMWMLLSLLSEIWILHKDLAQLGNGVWGKISYPNCDNRGMHEGEGRDAAIYISDFAAGNPLSSRASTNQVREEMLRCWDNLHIFR